MNNSAFRFIFVALMTVALQLASSQVSANWSGTKGILGIRSDSFMSSDYQATSHRTVNFLKVGVKTSGVLSDEPYPQLQTGLQIDLDSQFSPELPTTSYLNIRQLYFQEGAIVVGRQVENRSLNWTLIDRLWSFGLYEPQFRGRPLEPEAQGLTGIFVHFDGNVEDIPWGATLFGSLISIPDQGPNYSLKNGQFEAANPWFQPLPQSVRNSRTGVVDKVHYELQAPETNKILFNQSFAGQVYMGQVQQGSFARLGYAYKPSNQLSIAVDGAAGLNKTTEVQALPALNYHRIISADYFYSGSLAQAGFGFAHEKPESPEYEKNWSYRSFGESLLSTAFLSLTWSRFQTRLRALSVSGAESEVLGPKANIFESLLPQRFPYRQAAALDTNYKVYWKKYEAMGLGLTYLQGLDADYSEVIAKLDYQLNSHWTAGGQLTLLHAADDEVADKTIFSAYENNDSLLIGMTYVF